MSKLRPTDSVWRNGTMNALLEIEDWKPTAARLDRSAPEQFRIGAAVVDRRTGRVERPGGVEKLRAKELELLLHLYENATITFTRQQLLQNVWNFAATLMTRTVDQTVATLRKKIEIDPDQPQNLQTVYGVGYRLVL
jgi:DNA-binding response OmpR family regulator